MKTSELLRKAADEIRRRGWHQGEYGDNLLDPKGCRVCSLGAIRAAGSGTPWGEVNQATQASARWLLKATGAMYVDRWNDTDGRTVEEVLEKFEEAARAAEREGD